jgi:tRNA threonylcarbamoyladenosine biosynthesis protein TsaB
MKILLIETSGRVGQIGAALKGQMLAQSRLDEQRRHCQDLAPTVQALLRAQAWKPAAIDAVFVSLGPGSYTGLRVGVMAAKAFAYATGCKLVGVPTFDIIALPALASQAKVEVIEDAQQGRVYAQRFAAVESGLPRAVGPIAVLEHEAWLAQLDPAWALAGPGLRKKHDCLPSRQPLAPDALWTPALPALLRLGLVRLAGGAVDDCRTLEPIYARLSSAEEKWTALGR